MNELEKLVMIYDKLSDAGKIIALASANALYESEKMRELKQKEKAELVGA